MHKIDLMSALKFGKPKRTRLLGAYHQDPLDWVALQLASQARYFLAVANARHKAIRAAAVT